MEINAKDKINEMERDFLATCVTTESELKNLIDKYTDLEIENYTYHKFNEQMDKRRFVEFMKQQTGLSRRINS